MTSTRYHPQVYSHGRPPVRGLGGMVTSAHPLATMAGSRMLQAGGNAFDAIAATAAALHVVEPYMSGLAGLGMATVFTAKDRRVRALDFHPPVPREFDANNVDKAATTDGPNAIHESLPPTRISSANVVLSRTPDSVYESHACTVALWKRQ